MRLDTTVAHGIHKGLDLSVVAARAQPVHGGDALLAGALGHQFANGGRGRDCRRGVTARADHWYIQLVAHSLRAAESLSVRE